MVKKEITKIKMALGINKEICLFMKKDEKGLFLGKDENYQKMGEYTNNDLIKLCNNESNYIFYSIFDILKNADNEENQEKLKKVYYLLQK